MIGGRMTAVVSGAVALLALIGVAAAASDDPTPTGPTGPTGPTEAECDEMRAYKSQLQAERTALNDQAIYYQEQALMAAQAGDTASANQATQQYQAAIGQRNAIDGAISQLNISLGECE